MMSHCMDMPTTMSTAESPTANFKKRQKTDNESGRRLSFRMKTFLRNLGQTNQRSSVDLVNDIRSYITCTPDDQKETEQFLATIRCRINHLHMYNMNLFKIHRTYPRSHELIQLLVRYVELEYTTFYKHGIYKMSENVIMHRILNFLHVIIYPSIKSDNVHEKAYNCSQYILRLLCKVRDDYKDDKRIIGKMLLKILNKLRIINSNQRPDDIVNLIANTSIQSKCDPQVHIDEQENRSRQASLVLNDVHEKSNNGSWLKKQSLSSVQQNISTVECDSTNCFSTNEHTKKDSNLHRVDVINNECETSSPSLSSAEDMHQTNTNDVNENNYNDDVNKNNFNDSDTNDCEDNKKCDISKSSKDKKEINGDVPHNGHTEESALESSTITRNLNPIVDANAFENFQQSISNNEEAQYVQTNTNDKEIVSAHSNNETASFNPPLNAQNATVFHSRNIIGDVKSIELPTHKISTNTLQNSHSTINVEPYIDLTIDSEEETDFSSDTPQICVKLEPNENNNFEYPGDMEIVTSSMHDKHCTITNSLSNDIELKSKLNDPIVDDKHSIPSVTTVNSLKELSLRAISNANIVSAKPLSTICEETHYMKNNNVWNQHNNLNGNSNVIIHQIHDENEENIAPEIQSPCPFKIHSVVGGQTDLTDEYETSSIDENTDIIKNDINVRKNTDDTILPLPNNAMELENNLSVNNDDEKSNESSNNDYKCSKLSECSNIHFNEIESHSNSALEMETKEDIRSETQNDLKPSQNIDVIDASSSVEHHLSPIKDSNENISVSQETTEINENSDSTIDSSSGIVQNTVMSSSIQNSEYCYENHNFNVALEEDMEKKDDHGLTLLADVSMTCGSLLIQNSTECSTVHSNYVPEMKATGANDSVRTNINEINRSDRICNTDIDHHSKFVNIISDINIANVNIDMASKCDDASETVNKPGRAKRKRKPKKLLFTVSKRRRATKCTVIQENQLHVEHNRGSDKGTTERSNLDDVKKRNNVTVINYNVAIVQDDSNAKIDNICANLLLHKNQKINSGSDRKSHNDICPTKLKASLQFVNHMDKKIRRSRLKKCKHKIDTLDDDIEEICYEFEVDILFDTCSVTIVPQETNTVLSAICHKPLLFQHTDVRSIQKIEHSIENILSTKACIKSVPRVDPLRDNLPLIVRPKRKRKRKATITYPNVENKNGNEVLLKSENSNYAEYIKPSNKRKRTARSHISQQVKANDINYLYFRASHFNKDTNAVGVDNDVVSDMDNLANCAQNNKYNFIPHMKNKKCMLSQFRTNNTQNTVKWCEDAKTSNVPLNLKSKNNTVSSANTTKELNNSCQHVSTSQSTKKNTERRNLFKTIEALNRRAKKFRVQNCLVNMASDTSDFGLFFHLNTKNNCTSNFNKQSQLFSTFVNHILYTYAKFFAINNDGLKFNIDLEKIRAGPSLQSQYLSELGLQETRNILNCKKIKNLPLCEKNQCTDKETVAKPDSVQNTENLQDDINVRNNGTESIEDTEANHKNTPSVHNLDIASEPIEVNQCNTEKVNTPVNECKNHEEILSSDLDSSITNLNDVKDVGSPSMSVESNQLLEILPSTLSPKAAPLETQLLLSQEEKEETGHTEEEQEEENLPQQELSDGQYEEQENDRQKEPEKEHEESDLNDEHEDEENQLEEYVIDESKEDEQYQESKQLPQHYDQQYQHPQIQEQLSPLWSWDCYKKRHSVLLNDNDEQSCGLNECESTMLLSDSLDESSTDQLHKDNLSTKTGDPILGVTNEDNHNLNASQASTVDGNECYVNDVQLDELLFHESIVIVDEDGAEYEMLVCKQENIDDSTMENSFNATKEMLCKDETLQQHKWVSLPQYELFGTQHFIDVFIRQDVTFIASAIDITSNGSLQLSDTSIHSDESCGKVSEISDIDDDTDKNMHSASVMAKWQISGTIVEDTGEQKVIVEPIGNGKNVSSLENLHEYATRCNGSFPAKITVIGSSNNYGEAIKRNGLTWHTPTQQNDKDSLNKNSNQNHTCKSPSPHTTSTTTEPSRIRVRSCLMPDSVVISPPLPDSDENVANEIEIPYTYENGSVVHNTTTNSPSFDDFIGQTSSNLKQKSHIETNPNRNIQTNCNGDIQTICSRNAQNIANNSRKLSSDPITTKLSYSDREKYFSDLFDRLKNEESSRDTNGYSDAKKYDFLNGKRKHKDIIDVESKSNRYEKHSENHVKNPSVPMTNGITKRTNRLFGSKGETSSPHLAHLSNDIQCRLSDSSSLSSPEIDVSHNWEFSSASKIKYSDRRHRYSLRNTVPNDISDRKRSLRKRPLNSTRNTSNRSTANKYRTNSRKKQYAWIDNFAKMTDEYVTSDLFRSVAETANNEDQ